MDCSAMTGRTAHNIAANLSKIIAVTAMTNVAYADGHNNKQHAPDYIDSAKYPAFAAFAKKHRCSPEIEQLVRDNQSKKTHIQNAVYKYDEIPFYNKGKRFDRIAYSELIKQAVKENNLDHINVPDKCLCHMYGTKWNVIVKEAKKQQKSSPISLIEVQRFVKLIKKTGYRDLHSDNFVQSESNKITIIDTEKRGFAKSKHEYNDIVTRLSCDGINFDNEAKEWLTKQREEIEAINQSVFSLLYYFLFTPEQYKKPDIDLDQIMNEYVFYQNSKK